MKKFIQSIIVCFILIVNSIPIFGNILKEKYTFNNVDDLDDFIIDKMQKNHLPGLSASIVIDDVVMWQKAYGFADIERNINVTNETLFKIASVSKTITATALMQLYEQGYFNLSDPINEYLPYNVVNPLYPSTNITFHMLLTHSSSINDNWEYLFYFVGDAPIPFQTFLEEYFVPGGKYYDAENNFCPWEPGSNWDYSNIAVALIGYLVEIISDVNFTDYIQTNLFSSLNMNESAWYLRDLNVSHIAMPYQWDGEKYIPYGHIGYVDVPAGDLRTSTSQLINFLMMFINNGNYNGQEILENNTVELMLTPQLPFQQNIGLIWWKNIIGGRIVWGHNGADFGARAMMHFDPNTHIGVTVFTNGESDLTDICDALFDYAETIKNFPPNAPNIYGPSEGKPTIEYTYTLNATDSDNDSLFYFIEWGDGGDSSWIGPFPSGEVIIQSHTWSKKGTYIIKAKVKDIHGNESSWGTLSVTMPCLYNIPFQLFWERMFERFPHAFPILRHLMGY